MRVLNSNASTAVQAVWVPQETGGVYVISQHPPSPVLGFGIINGTEADVPVTQIQAFPAQITVTEGGVSQTLTNFYVTGNLKPFSYSSTGAALPAFATLDPSLGILTIAPQPGDAGTTTGHQVTITDQKANVAALLPTFDIVVLPQETYTGTGAGEFRTPGLFSGEADGTFVSLHTGSGEGEFGTAPDYFVGDGQGSSTGQQTHNGTGAGEFRTPGLLLGEGDGTFVPQAVYEGTGAGEFGTAPDYFDGQGLGSFVAAGGATEGVFVGPDLITECWFGNTPVNEIYVGATRVWPAEPGQELFTASGTWVCPDGVYSVSVVCVGGGGSTTANQFNPAGGNGGSLGYRNNIDVSPGNSYTVVVGAAGQTSYFIDSGTVSGGGAGGAYVGDGGGTGGSGGAGASSSGNPSGGGGGGGAGGYSGNGGNGGRGGITNTATAGGDGTNGAGGGGGGGDAPTNGHTNGGYGGGVGVYGEGSSGSGGAAGTFGSPGSNGGNGSGGAYGYGAPGDGNGNYTGGPGAVRIIWGLGRSFPNNAADV
jgi:hypothetical protein